jgi:hypothetical protein
MELVRYLGSTSVGRSSWRLLLAGIALMGGQMLAGCGDDDISSRTSEEDSPPTSFTTEGPPPIERLALYKVNPPVEATKVSYWSNEGWMAGQLWVRFETSPAGLQDFLTSMDIERAELDPGTDPFSSADKRDADWTEEIEAATEYLGYESAGADSPGQHRPSYRIMVDESDPDTPVVYVTALIV